MRAKWLLFAGIAILAGVAAGALSLWHSSSHPMRPSAAAKGPMPTSQVVNEVSLRAQVQAQQVIKVPAPIEGVVDQMNADVGQDVSQGQLLAHIRNGDLESALEAATADREKVISRIASLEGDIVAQRLEVSRAHADSSRARTELDRAQKAYERQQLLYREGATPRLIYEKSQRDFNNAKDDFESKDALAGQADDRLGSLTKEMDAAKRDLEDKTEALEGAKIDVNSGDVRSPVDGLLIARRAEPGDRVNRSMDDLFRIGTNLVAMEAIAQADQPTLQRIKPGQPASIIVAEMPNESIAGTVRDVSGGQITIDFISPTPLIKPGATAQVRIKLT